MLIGLALQQKSSMPANSIGEALRRLRLSAGLQGKDLAKMVDISRPYLSQIEKGNRHPSGPLIGRLASALQTTPERITGQCSDGGTGKPIHGESVSRMSPRMERVQAPTNVCTPCQACADRDAVIAARDGEVAYLKGIVAQQSDMLRDQAATLRALAEGVCRYPCHATPDSQATGKGPTDRMGPSLSRAG